MSEKSIAELIESLRQQSPGTAERDATVEMIEARITRAEAAERAVQALVVWMHDSTTANWEPVMDALQEHADQGRVVRRLGESNKSD